MKYNKQTYKSILQSALERGFKFLDFSSVKISEGKNKQLLLRHDIDYSIALAYQMAEIDAALKIKSTFALLLNSPLYNPLNPDNVKFIDDMHKLGHNVALHHHVLPGQNAEDIRNDILKEMQIARIAFPYIQNVFIWHDLPAKNLMSDIEITGMVNAYDTKYIKSMFYISDSVLRHTPETFIKTLDEHQLIHMLLHPIIWMSEQDDMIAMVSHILTGIIRDCDKEFLVNRAWKANFPDGIPQELLDKLHERLTGTG